MNSAPKVNFIGIGAQKCASSWVHKVLAEHPQAFLSTPKELDYFSYFWGRGHDWYERFFEAAPTGARIVGDNSPSYFVHPLAPARAARYNPYLKIVLALRDPVERAYSNHLHMVREGFLRGPDLSFEYGLSRNEMYVEQSRYATHFGRWLDHFPREQFFIVIQEEIAVRTQTLSGDLYGFLGLDQRYRPASAGERANASAVARAPGLDRFLRASAGVLRRAGLAAVVEAVRRSDAVDRYRRSSRVDLREIVPPMREDTRRRLRETLAPEVEALCRLLDRAAPPWPTADAVLRGDGTARAACATASGLAALEVSK